MKQKFFMFLLLMICIFSCYSIAYGEDETVLSPQTIFGNINLPDGRVAPEGGLKVNVIAENSTCKKSVECTIPEGESTAAYCLKVDYPYYGYEVRCELVTPVKGYYAVSYYIGNAEKTTFEDPLMKPMKVSTSETESRDITLVKGIKVTGIVMLPDARTVECDSSIDVSFCALSELINVADGDPTRFQYFSKVAKVVIKAGESIGTFEIDLPAYEGGYFYYYKLNDYISGVWQQSYKTEMSNYLSTDSSIIIELDKGNVVKGKLCLPEGKVAGEGGFPVILHAIYYTMHNTIGGPTQFGNYIDRKVIIPEGENSVDYEMTVYPEYKNYNLMYDLSAKEYLDKGYYSIDAKEYVDKAYYSKEGTVTKIDTKNCELKIEDDVSGIDIQILKGVKFSGNIIYPEGKVAEEDLTGTLGIRNAYYHKEIPFVIKKGESSADFECILSEDLEDFNFYYDVNSNDIYPTRGYYTEKGTAYSSEYKLSVKSNQLENIQFPIRKNIRVPVKVQIPLDIYYNEDQKFNITAMAKNEEGIFTEVDSKSFVCSSRPEVEAFKYSSPIFKFELFIPTHIDEIIIRCDISSKSNGDPLMIGGYLGEDELVFDKEKAKIFKLDQINEYSVSIWPVKGERIWGSIQINSEIKDYIAKGFSIEYNFVDHSSDPDSIGERKFTWENETALSQNFFMNIPPLYMDEKFTLKLKVGDREDQEFYIGENGLTKDEKMAKLFTCDCVDIKDLRVVVDASSLIIYGDLNNDGLVNAIDFAKYREYLLEMIDEDEVVINNADLNKDGATNAIDFAILRKYLLGSIEELPVN